MGFGTFTRHLGSMFAFTGFLVSLLTFQNCSSQNLFQKENSQSEPNRATESGGNGQGYDGKPYILSGTCSEEISSVVARIWLLNSGDAITDRENCRNISPPRTLAASSWRIDATNPSLLIYQNQYYFDSSIHSEARSQDPTDNPLKASCDTDQAHSMPTLWPTIADPSGCPPADPPAP